MTSTVSAARRDLVAGRLMDRADKDDSMTLPPSRPASAEGIDCKFPDHPERLAVYRAIRRSNSPERKRGRSQIVLVENAWRASDQGVVIALARGKASELDDSRPHDVDRERANLMAVPLLVAHNCHQPRPSPRPN